MDNDSITYHQDIEAELRKRENFDLASIATSIRDFTRDIIIIDNLSFIHHRNQQKQERKDQRKREQIKKQQVNGENLIGTNDNLQYIEINLNAEHNVRLSRNEDELSGYKDSKCTRCSRKDKWLIIVSVMICVGSLFVIALFFMPLWVKTLKEQQQQNLSDSQEKKLSEIDSINDILHIHTTSLSPSENIETNSPTIYPTTLVPTMIPTISPSYSPTPKPTSNPSFRFRPTPGPTKGPSFVATDYPTNIPTIQSTFVDTTELQTLLPTATNESSSSICDFLFFIC